jgi:hypothetical protein
MKSPLVAAALIAACSSSTDTGSRPPSSGGTAAFDAFAAAAGKAPEAPAALLGFLLPHLAPLYRECVAGSRMTCALFDQVYTSAALLAQRDRAGSASILATACKGGDDIQCTLAAEALDDPGGTSNETPQAIAGLVAVCKRGVLHACERAADIRIGAGIEHPAIGEAEATAQVERACQAGLVDGCRVLVALSGAIPPPPEFAGSPQYRTRERACTAGDAVACADILEMVKPAPPFGCSLCDPKAAEHSDWKLLNGAFDERCMDCEIARCRRDSCCPTCPDRNRSACCSDEVAPRSFPEKPPAPDPAAWRAAATSGRTGTAGGVALISAGCKRGLVAWCGPSKELEARLATLEHLPP